MIKNSIIYCLTVEDIQTVSNQEIERDLSAAEIESIKDKIAGNIDWYGAIANAIPEKALSK